MNGEHEIQFGTLQKDGTLTNVRGIKQSDIGRCPHVIMVASHYREDGTCKCDDPKEQAMMIKEWGYAKKDFAQQMKRQAEGHERVYKRRRNGK